jgi:hypothetical protein
VGSGRRKKMKAVYSPCVESLEYMYDSKNKKLDPNTFTVLDDGEARFVVKKFAHFGVRFLATKKGKGKSKGKTIVDEASVAEAKAEWEKGNKKWAEETLVDFNEATKAKREAGVPIEEPPQVKTAKKLLGVGLMLLLLVLPTASWAQDTGQHKSANFLYKYDVASDTITYGALAGQQGDPYATAYDGPGAVETVGSNTTVTGVNAADDVFLVVDPGDVIFIRFQNGTVEDRVVVTNADDDTITVDTAIDLDVDGGYRWSYKKLATGTGETDGWISVAGYSIVQFGVQYDAGDVTALAATFECKSAALGAKPIRVYPGVNSDCGDGTLNGKVCEFTTVGDRLYFKMPHNAFAACRVGVAWVTAVGAGVDEITAVIDVGR